MVVTIQAEVPPLHRDGSGAIRIGGSRVLLDLIVRAFQDGATAEDIAQRYPTASLSDVYAVIAYFLRHRVEVEAYLAERDRKAGEVRDRIETAQGDLGEIRRRLLAQKRT
jgi:uncharacterized protein (DUF433 family)